MSVRYGSIKLQVPRGFKSLLEHLAREILREQPKNIPEFAAAYFKRLLQRREEGYTDPYLVSEHIVESSPQAEEESAPPTAEEEVVAVDEPEAQAPPEPEPAKEQEEEMPDLNDPDVLKAATVIQASFRGFKTRKESSAGSSNILQARDSAGAGTSAKARQEDEARRQIAKEELIEQLIVTGEGFTMGYSLNRESSACIIESEYELCPETAGEEQAAVPRVEEVVGPIETMEVEALAPAAEDVKGEATVQEVKDSQELEEIPPTTMDAEAESHAATCQSVVCTFSKDKGSSQNAEEPSSPKEESVVIEEEIVAAVKVKAVSELPPEVVMASVKEQDVPENISAQAVAEESALVQPVDDEGIVCDEQLANGAQDVTEQSIEESQLPCEKSSAPAAVEIIEEVVTSQEEAAALTTQVEEGTEVLSKETTPCQAEELNSSAVEEKTPEVLIEVAPCQPENEQEDSREIVIGTGEITCEAAPGILEEAVEEVVESPQESAVCQEEKSEETGHEPLQEECSEETTRPVQQDPVAEESVQAVCVEVTEEAIPPDAMIETAELPQDAAVQEEEVTEVVESVPLQETAPEDESPITGIGDSSESPKVEDEVITEEVVEVQEASIQESAPEPLEQVSIAPEDESQPAKEVETSETARVEEQNVAEEIVETQQPVTQQTVPDQECSPSTEDTAPVSDMESFSIPIFNIEDTVTKQTLQAQEEDTTELIESENSDFPKTVEEIVAEESVLPVETPVEETAAQEQENTNIWEEIVEVEMAEQQECECPPSTDEEVPMKRDGETQEEAAEQAPAEQSTEKADEPKPTEAEAPTETQEAPAVEETSEEVPAEAEPPTAEETSAQEDVPAAEEVKEKKEDAVEDVEEKKEDAVEEVEKKEEAAEEVEKKEEVVEEVQEKKEVVEEVEEKKEEVVEEEEEKKEEVAEETPAEDSHVQEAAEVKPEEPAATEKPVSTTEETQEPAATEEPVTTTEETQESAATEEPVSTTEETQEPAATEQAPQEAPEEVPAVEEAPAEQQQEPAVEEAQLDEAAAQGSEETQAEENLKVETAELTEIEPAQEPVEEVLTAAAEDTVKDDEETKAEPAPETTEAQAEDQPAAE